MVGVIIMFLGGLIALVALLGPGAEGWARLLAAGLLFLHPVHEQRKGFRMHFNHAVNGERPDWRGGSVRRMMNYELRPLSRRMNLFQALALATVFPALALLGPWWAFGAILSFYIADAAWTHARKRVPGLSSAFVAAVAAFCSAVLVRPEIVSRWEQGAAAASLFAGLLILAIPWWMAYRAVGRG